MDALFTWQKITFYKLELSYQEICNYMKMLCDEFNVQLLIEQKVA